METTSIALIRTVRNCRWSRHGYRVSGVPDELQPETPWVCVRSGDRLPVRAQDCDDCRHWEHGSPQRLH